jgi:energy-coupling factor transporter ATP-binding protein EcfA2
LGFNLSEEIEETEEFETEEIETAEPTQTQTPQESSVFEEMPIESTDINIIIGKRRSGKSTLLKAIMESTEPAFKQQTSQVLGEAKEFIKIDPLMEFNGQYIRYGDTIKYNEVLKKMFKSKNEFIVTDEADGFFKNRQNLSTVQNEFINIGRHWGLGGLFITRRLAKLHTDLVSNANKLFIFKLWTKADLDYLRGADLGDFVPIVTGLEKYQFLGIDLDNNTYTVFNPI